MKLSKSILSPSHTRDPPLSLPTSLSRRLRANGSIKGGQSPATFPTTATGKKRGSGFDNPEPSSPKVTCIGQVKMKTKKKVRQSRSLSKRRSDISFRKLEQAPEERGLLIQNQRSSSVHFQPQDQCAAAAHRNQRWVHLPLTIYEALRELSCLFPCRSSCFSTNEKEKEGKVNGSREVDNNGGQRACGDVVARWLVALHEGEAEETRGIELVVTNGKEEEERMEEMQSTMRSSRRHVFEGIEFKDHECVEMKEEKARVSICIPPKNALLLMRCRSDPMKMADITNRFWESPTRKETDEEEDKKEIGENDGVGELGDAQNFECNNEVEVPEESNVSVDLVENEENPEAVEVFMEMKIESSCKDEDKFKSGELTPEAEQEDEEKSEIKALVAEVNSIEQVPESIVDQTTENTQDNQVAESEKEEEDSSIQSNSSFSESSNGEYSRTENVLSEDAATMGVEEGEGEEEEERFKSTIKKVIEETLLLEDIDGEDVKQTHQEAEEEDAKSDAAISDPEKNKMEKEYGYEVQVGYPKEPRKQQNESILPDCLLLMMCEPKLSMEVSKETWVCSSTDFILPERKQAKTVKKKKKKKEIPEEPKTRSSIDKSQHLLLQPPRSSCSFPVAGVPAMSMATMIEQKLVNAVAYEPFVLTRCKSEPMAAAAAKLTPETCFWKNRKIEPHRRATFGFGAAGVGF